MSPTQKRTGFTFLELLVFLAILAMLLGLLLPAVQKVREAGGRTQVANNLRQVGISVHAYHDVYRTFPPATDNVGLFANLRTPATLSMHILPYVEQLQLAQSILAGIAVPVKINTFSVEYDPSTTDHISVQNFAGNVRAFTDAGVNTAWDKPVVLKSPMPCKTNLGRSFPDGTSNTMMFATRYASSGMVSMNGKSPTPCGYYDLPLANNGGSFFGATPMTGTVSATSTSGWQLGTHARASQLCFCRGHGPCVCTLRHAGCLL